MRYPKPSYIPLREEAATGKVNNLIDTYPRYIHMNTQHMHILYGNSVLQTRKHNSPDFSHYLHAMGVWLQNFKENST